MPVKKKVAKKTATKKPAAKKPAKRGQGLFRTLTRTFMPAFRPAIQRGPRFISRGGSYQPAGVLRNMDGSGAGPPGVLRNIRPQYASGLRLSGQ